MFCSILAGVAPIDAVHIHWSKNGPLENEELSDRHALDDRV
jgi:hypothetical protein